MGPSLAEGNGKREAKRTRGAPAELTGTQKTGGSEAGASLESRLRGGALTLNIVGQLCQPKNSDDIQRLSNKLDSKADADRGEALDQRVCALEVS